MLKYKKTHSPKLAHQFWIQKLARVFFREKKSQPKI